MQIASAFQTKESELFPLRRNTAAKKIENKLFAQYNTSPIFPPETYAELSQLATRATLASHPDLTLPPSLILTLQSQAKIANTSPDLSTELTKIFIKTVSEFNHHLDEKLRRGDTIILDPYVRGSVAESLSQSTEDGGSILVAFKKLAQKVRTPESRFLINYHLASLGFGHNPIDIQAIYSILQNSGNAELRAAVASHRNMDIGNTEILATLKILSEARDWETQAAAIETLILHDQIQKVQPDLLSIWTESNLNSIDYRRQRRCVTYLAKTRSGRNKLLELINNDSLNSKAVDVTCSVLREHIRATRKLNRFDFIDESEILEIESTLIN